MDGCLSLNLRCIVVKATQVLESSLVAELVLVLGEKQRIQTECIINIYRCNKQAWTCNREILTLPYVGNAECHVYLYLLVW